MTTRRRTASDSSSSSSSTAPRLMEPLKYTRNVDPGFGNRLADARNLVHTQAPLVPVITKKEHRTAVGSVALEVANSIRQAALIPPGAPKHGWEKGSYRSPFDYHIANYSAGDNSVAPVRPFPHASPSSITPLTLTGTIAPASNHGAQSKAIHAGVEYKSGSTSPCRTVTPGFDAKERHLFLGPLRMIREKGISLYREDREKLFAFIDKYMSESLHTVIECDGILPNVVYRISIPMTDANWVKYNQLLAVFGFASNVHDMLAVGSDQFDHYTYVIDGTSLDHVESWEALASASERDLDMSTLSRELIKMWKGMWVEGGAGYVGTWEHSKQ